MNVTDVFIDYIYETACTSFPMEVIIKAKQVLLDYLGVTFGGTYADGNVLNLYCLSTHGSCTVLGNNFVKTDMQTAAFVNGFHAHILELDDGHRFGMLHLGAVIISAVLAIAEQELLSFDQVLKGIVLGYEAAARTAICIQPGHKKLGYHTTSTCGTIGAAIGCAVAMNIDKVKMKAVLSAAATSSAGLLEIQENASQLKAYNIAHAAMSGVVAAMIGKCGLCGPDDIMGSDRGFLAIHSKTVDIDKLIKKEPYYEIQRIYVKPYAACRHCHSALEAIMNIKQQIRVEASDIEAIYVDTYNLAIRGHDHIDIKGIQSAKLSIPYSIAAAYILGTGNIDAFTAEKIADKKILSLARKVVIKENMRFTALSPEKRIAEVTIHTKQGKIASSRVDYAKGDPENPMTGEDIINKFMALMTWCDEKKKAEKIIELFSSSIITSENFFEIL